MNEITKVINRLFLIRLCFIYLSLYVIVCSWWLTTFLKLCSVPVFALFFFKLVWNDVWSSFLICVINPCFFDQLLMSLLAPYVYSHIDRFVYPTIDDSLTSGLLSPLVVCISNFQMLFWNILIFERSLFVDGEIRPDGYAYHFIGISTRLQVVSSNFHNFIAGLALILSAYCSIKPRTSSHLETASTHEMQ